MCYNIIVTAVFLEQTGTSLDLVASPLGHSIEFGSGALQDSFELHIGQVALQITPVHVGRQAIVGDQQQMVRVDFGRLVHQHRVRHVGQATTDRLLWIVIGQRTGVGARGGNVGSEGTPIAFRYGIDGDVAFSAAELRTVGLISKSTEREIRAVTVS